MISTKPSMNTSRENDRPPILKLEIFDQRHTPSWRGHGVGCARLDLDGHTGAKWVAVWLEEWIQGGRGTISKKAHLTLDERAARGLRDFLNDVLGEQPAAPEMLGALRGLLADGGPLSDPVSRKQANDRARAVIAKAEGRE